MKNLRFSHLRTLVLAAWFIWSVPSAWAQAPGGIVIPCPPERIEGPPTNLNRLPGDLVPCVFQLVPANGVTVTVLGWEFNGQNALSPVFSEQTWGSFEGGGQSLDLSWLAGPLQGTFSVKVKFKRNCGGGGPGGGGDAPEETLEWGGLVDGKVWTPGTLISGTLTGSGYLHAEGKTVLPGGGLTLTVGNPEDKDDWTEGAQTGNEADTLQYAWTASGGTLAGGAGATNGWTAPTTPGAYTITCTVKDGGTGGRNDPDLVLTLAVKVVQKTWSGFPAIGVVMDPLTLLQKVVAGVPVFDGRMTAPRNQTVNPAVPARVIVSPLTHLLCGTEAASDFDEWRLDVNGDGSISNSPADAEKGYVSDTTTSTWTCSGGGFVMVDNAGTETLVSSIASTDPNFAQWNGKWKAPAAAGEYTITCSIDDRPTDVVAPEAGNRGDEALRREVTVTVYSASIRFLSAQVAAGGGTGPAHTSKVEVSITNSENIPLQGITFNRPIVSSGLTSDGTPAREPRLENFPATDVNGLSISQFTSGRRTESGIEIKIPFDVINPASGLGPIAEINQTWGSGEWILPGYFELDEPTIVKYVMIVDKGNETIGINGHLVNFIPSIITGWEWNSEAGEDWDNDGEVDGDYVWKPYAETDVDSSGWNTWKSLVQFTMKTEENIVGESGGGLYCSELTVEWNENFYTDSIEFYMSDDDVYNSLGNNFTVAE